MRNIKPYPPEQAWRGGMKVSWNYYAKKEDADACAEAARSNASYYASQGFDFGYQSPGSEPKLMEGHTGEWEKYNGLWEVCLP